MLPYRDELRTQRPPVVTIALIAANVLVWVLVQGAGAPRPLLGSICDLGLIPGQLTGAVPPGTSFAMGGGWTCLIEPGRRAYHLLTSMFLHASWVHLLGNMWFLWIFGDNVEDAMTRSRFLALYVLGGLAAALAQVVAGPSSVLPMVGASGAVGAIMGAYLVLYPTARVYAFVPLGFLITSIALPAWSMLLYWAGLQLLNGLASVKAGAGTGVAFWAHVGGFTTGLLLARPFARVERVAAQGARRWRPRRVLWG
jgi:membrane associated rhomboid family serine protease